MSIYTNQTLAAEYSKVSDIDRAIARQTGQLYRDKKIVSLGIDIHKEMKLIDAKKSKLSSQNRMLVKWKYLEMKALKKAAELDAKKRS